jgi:hypothetical protein
VTANRAAYVARLGQNINSLLALPLRLVALNCEQMMPAKVQHCQIPQKKLQAKPARPLRQQGRDDNARIRLGLAP